MSGWHGMQRAFIDCCTIPLYGRNRFRIYATMNMRMLMPDVKVVYTFLVLVVRSRTPCTSLVRAPTLRSHVAVLEREGAKTFTQQCNCRCCARGTCYFAVKLGSSAAACRARRYTRLFGAIILDKRSPQDAAVGTLEGRSPDVEVLMCVPHDMEATTAALDRSRDGHQNQARQQLYATIYALCAAARVIRHHQRGTGMFQ